MPEVAATSPRPKKPRLVKNEPRNGRFRGRHVINRVREYCDELERYADELERDTWVHRRVLELHYHSNLSAEQISLRLSSESDLWKRRSKPQVQYILSKGRRSA